MRIKDARQTFVGVWIRNLLEDRPFEVWGGDQLRDFNYVDDVIDACIVCATDDRANGRVFNLGSREVVSLAQLAEVLVSINGGGEYEIRTFPTERKKIDIGDYYSDYGFIEATLGWRPRVDLRSGLMRTLSYFKEHGQHYL
jgi:nucleoside-diphosphate-sugar epimerase